MARRVPPPGVIVHIQQVMPVNHLVRGTCLTASAQKMHLRSCVGFFKGLWIGGREKRTLSGIREQRHRTSLRGVACKTLSGGKKDPNQVSEPEGPCHQPGYNIGFCVCPAAALCLNTDPLSPLCIPLCPSADPTASQLPCLKARVPHGPTHRAT